MTIIGWVFVLMCAGIGFAIGYVVGTALRFTRRINALEEKIAALSRSSHWPNV